MKHITDDPGAKTVICRRGRNRMFCGNAAGQFIPPMVIYKSEHCYENWATGGYNNTVYDCTANGWFDWRMFETWFFKQFILSIRKHQEKQVVLIGDNLGSHFSPKVIDACVQNDIIFICLPPNTTHSCQPLNVTVFCSAKIEWKDILVEGQSFKRLISLNAMKVNAKVETSKFNCWIQGNWDMSPKFK